MSTTLTSTVSQRAVNTFIGLFKPTSVEVRDGMIFLSDLDGGLLAVGETDHPSVRFGIDAAAFKRYVRAAKAKADLGFQVSLASNDEPCLYVECTALGTMDFAAKGIIHRDQPGIFDKLGDCVVDYGMDDVANLARISSRCDDESSRFVLGCVHVCLDAAIATDGRRLVKCVMDAKADSDAFTAGRDLLARKTITFATRLGYEISMFANGYAVAGELIAKAPDGRYPYWQQVIPKNCDNKKTFSAKELLDQCDRFIARAKSADNSEYGIEIDLTHTLKVRLDARYVIEAIGKDVDSIQIAWPDTFSKCGKFVNGPVIIDSVDRDWMFEVIMPMSLGQ